MTQATESFISLDAIRDRVVDLCGDVTGARVLDAGCGDGLIGRALLARVGGGSVLFADHDSAAVSTLEAELGREPGTAFLTTDLRTLAGIPDASLDVVVIRAVLLYIAEKDDALAAARRVLAPGGQLVISEPVNRLMYDEPGRLWGYELRSIPEIAEKMRRGFMEDAPAEVRAMTDWTDQALLSLVVDSGFRNCLMETVTEVFPGRPLPWLAFLHARWTPWMPTVAHVMMNQLDVREQQSFEATLRPLVERGQGATRYCNTFISAVV